MTINIIFMDSSEYQSVQKRFKNVVKYNGAVFSTYLRVLVIAYHYEKNCIY